MISKILNKIFSSPKFINLIIFCLIVSIFTNLVHKIHEKIDVKSNNNNFSLKEKVSIKFSSEDTYSYILDRSCEIKGDMHDRHKVRWIKSLFLKNVYQKAFEIKNTLPYYLNIFIHSLLIFLTLLILNKTYKLEKYYTLLFLLYVTFLFSNYLGEYSYSIFEMFFLSGALYFSKKNKIIPFTLLCILAVLNRESGFIILLTWFIFNNNIQKFIYAGIATILIFIFLNWDIINCLINPKFFIPLEDQKGQINAIDLLNMNFFSVMKLVFISFGLPFGIIIYYVSKTENKNIILILITFIYLLVFLFAVPMHHVAVRMLVLPLIFTSVYFYKLKD